MYSRKKIEQIIRDTKLLEQQIQASTDLYNLSKQKIQSYFDEADIKELELKMENTSTSSTLVAKKVERVTIVYNMDVLKANLSKDIYNEIANKQYSITNITKLTGLLKQAGISAKDFKECINVNVSINKEAIKQLYAVGDISKANMKGAYKATLSKYIQIKEGKGGSN